MDKRTKQNLDEIRAALEPYTPDVEKLQKNAQEAHREISKVAAAMRLQAKGVDFSDRELRLIDNCKAYAADDPAGLPGHNLMLIVAKMAKALGL